MASMFSRKLGPDTATAAMARRWMSRMGAAMADRAYLELVDGVAVPLLAYLLHPR